MTKLVCFDLDDTLIQHIHSVMLPCILNGKEKQHAIIQEQEENGEIDYIAADYKRAELLTGLRESTIKERLLEIAKPIENIAHVISALHEKNILSIVVTVGTKQVAKVVHDIWGFDGYYGSDYEVVNGIFTGKIKSYISADKKIDCLKDFCKKNNIECKDCVAVGDGITDIPIFEFCGKSIAINYSPSIIGKATYYLKTQDLSDILNYII